MTKLLKSDSICESYAQMKKGPVFLTRSVVIHPQTRVLPAGEHCFEWCHAACCVSVCEFVRVSRKRCIQCRERVRILCLALQIFLLRLLYFFYRATLFQSAVLAVEYVRLSHLCTMSKRLSTYVVNLYHTKIS